MAGAVMRSGLGRIRLGGVALVAIAIIALWMFQRRLVYLPSGNPGLTPPPWSDQTVTTDDGIELAVWHRAPAEKGPIVVVFNGNAGNRADRLDLGNALADAGFGVVLFDYRGFGGNGGAPTEEGLAEDARAVAAWIRRAHPDAPIALFGESLGAAVAVREAVDRPPDAVVLRSPFTSLADAASANYLGIPTGWFLRDAYTTLDRIGQLEVPVTVIAGTDDSIVPIGQSRRIYDAAAVEFEWVPIDGADHNDSELSSGALVVDAVLRITEHLER